MGLFAVKTLAVGVEFFSEQPAPLNSGIFLLLGLVWTHSPGLDRRW